MNCNHILTPTEISSLHLFSLNSSWDYQLAQNSTLNDLDMDTVKWFIQQLSQQKGKKITDPRMNVLEKYELIRENKPTFAALLLFPKKPSFILDVQIGLFEDEITIKKDKNIKKSVLFEVEEIMDFITAYTGAIQSKPRNRLLAQVFKELGIIEKYGAGVKRVIEDFRAYGLVEPSFEEKFGGFYVVVSDKKLESRTTQEIYNNIKEFGATTQEIGETTQEIANKIIQLIKENPQLSRRAMAEFVGISENGVKYHLKKLKKEGKITHIGPTKKGYWKINGS
jgi:predicted HTH transcriptional regulator